MLWRTLTLGEKMHFKKEGMEMEGRIRRQIIKKKRVDFIFKTIYDHIVKFRISQKMGINPTCKNHASFWKWYIHENTTFWKYIYIHKERKNGEALRFKIPWWTIKGHLCLSVSQRLLYIGAVPQSKTGSTKRNGQRIEDYLTCVKEKCQCKSRNISGRMILGKRT